MDSRLFFSILKLLSSSNLQSSRRRFSETFIRNSNPFASRSIYTEKCDKINLNYKISLLRKPGLCIVSELDKWVENGWKVRAAELQGIIRELRKCKRYPQALEVSEWMNNKGVCTFLPGDHAVQLDLIGTVRGLESAESYFNNLSGQDKNDKTYCALLNCYVRECLMEKSLSLMQKMKEMGFISSPLPYNDLMCLYTKTSQYEKVPGVLTEMIENGISPNNFSYNICINSYGARSDLDGMEKLLEEMKSQPDIVLDWVTYAMVANFYIKAGLTDKAITALKKSEENIWGLDKVGLHYNRLISLYASLGNKDEVLRLWGLEKAASKRYFNQEYATMLRSLVKLDDFEEAMTLLKEWESSGNSYDFRVPNSLLIGYCDKGLVEKANAMLEDIVMKGKRPTPNSWGIVAAGYVGKREMQKAVECMKKALSLHAGNEGWVPSAKVITRILGWLGDEGDVEGAEAFVSLLRTVIPMNKEMYHALIKANIREGKEVDGFLESMKADKIGEDEETNRILSLRRQS